MLGNYVNLQYNLKCLWTLIDIKADCQLQSNYKENSTNMIRADPALSIKHVQYHVQLIVGYLLIA